MVGLVAIACQIQWNLRIGTTWDWTLCPCLEIVLSLEGPLLRSNLADILLHAHYFLTLLTHTVTYICKFDHTLISPPLGMWVERRFMLLLMNLFVASVRLICE